MFKYSGADGFSSAGKSAEIKKKTFSILRNVTIKLHVDL